jgi:Delta7-sterol 5-desaturase
MGLISLAVEFVAVFAALLIVAYLIPAGLFHWLIEVRRTAVLTQHKIQDRRARAKDVRREIVHSLTSLVLFTLFSMALLRAYDAGWTAVYWGAHDYPLLWLHGSFIAAAVLHDTYFYWTHRLMHSRWLYPYFHSGHHKSVTPTPWAMLAFQPLETVPQFAFFALLILFVPLHPAVLLAYLVFDGLVNAAGHCGHEIVPKPFQRHWLLKYVNAVSHHDLHHSRFRYNFGQYFNVWDRLMGTFLDRSAAERNAGSKASSGTRAAAIRADT